jgi:multiple sugar transport system substrate-binding protein
MRHAIAMASMAALMAASAAACGGDEGSGGSADELTGRGPITIAQGKDTSGNLQKQINDWNTQHPNEKVRLIELPEDADAQRQQMVQNAQAKSDAYSVLSLDVVWTAEFAANRWITRMPENQFNLGSLLPPTVKTARYRDRLYAVPFKTNAGLLFYRTDLLEQAGADKPPTTWGEMTAACEKLDDPKVACYGGQFEKYEGLTVNFSEAVHSAGGVVVNDQGAPNVNTPQAKQGLDFLAQGLKSGSIPKEAITYKEEESRRAFEKGGLFFLRQWPYQWALSNKKGDSEVAGKFNVAPLPGANGAGAPTLGGYNLAISSFGKNKATALDFIKFATDQQRQRQNLLATSEAPTLASLYDDAELQKQFPYLTVLKQSILNARPRPVVVRYGDVTEAIQENAYAALTGTKTSDQALADMQAKLTELTKQK